MIEYLNQLQRRVARLERQAAANDTMALLRSVKTSSGESLFDLKFRFVPGYGLVGDDMSLPRILDPLKRTLTPEQRDTMNKDWVSLFSRDELRRFKNDVGILANSKEVNSNLSPQDVRIFSKVNNAGFSFEDISEAEFDRLVEVLASKQKRLLTYKSKRGLK